MSLSVVEEQDSYIMRWGLHITIFDIERKQEKKKRKRNIITDDKMTLTSHNKIFYSDLI
jgi:hypothetical protein